MSYYQQHDTGCTEDRLSKMCKAEGSHHSYLHHQEDRVEHDECHDEVLERRGLDDPPESVSHAHSLLGHVPLQRRGVDGKVNARFLQVYRTQTCGLRGNHASIPSYVLSHRW